MPDQQQRTNGQTNGKISISRATAGDIAKLRGVGPKTADAIVKYRDQNGAIRSREDLIKIYGISRSSADNLCSQLSFD